MYMVTKKGIAIPLNIMKIGAPATIERQRKTWSESVAGLKGQGVTLVQVCSPLAPAARLAPTFQAANPSAVKLI